MPKSQTYKKWKYDLHPSVRMVQSVIAGMKEKTGRSLEEWVRLVKKDGPGGEKERAAWLKKEHELGTNYAAWIAAHSVGKERRQSKTPANISSTPRITSTKCMPVRKNTCGQFTTRY